MYPKFFKRFFDICLALISLVFLTPSLVVITIWLFFANKGTGVFFTQERPGKNGKTFKLIKFKTMSDERDDEGNLLSDVQRITRIGKYLRSYSLDEIPQLLNIIKGEMSVIGPRPLLIKYLPLYSSYQARRHEVRPGLTGWAQCHGRNSISWSEKLKMDVWYVDNLTFITDMKVIYLSIVKVFKREGINSSSSVTMEAFTGKN